MIAEIYNTTYRARIRVWSDRDTFNRWCRQNEYADLKTATIGRVIIHAGQDKNGYIAIFLPLDSSPGTVAHECLHAAMFILNERGVGASTDSHEAAAYLMEWIIDEIQKRRKAKPKKKARKKRNPRRNHNRADVQ